MRPKRRPRFSAATANIIALVSLFVALGGVGVAATGGNFILGQANDAGAKTSLSADINDRAMVIENANTGPTAGGLSLKVAPHRPPLVVNQDAGKATNLDTDKLDGLSSESFTQGGGRLYSGHREGVPRAAYGTLLDIPGVMKVKYFCASSSTTEPPNVLLQFLSEKLHIAVMAAASTNGEPRYIPPDYPGITLQGTMSKPMIVHLLGSRALNRMTFQPAVLVDMRVAGAWNATTSRCSFQGVAEVFG